MHLIFKNYSKLFQLIDQIFSQLDEENNGYITSEKLLAIIKSIQDVPRSSKQDTTTMSTSPNPQFGVFSNSPTSLPCVSYFTDYSLGPAQATASLQNILKVPLFSQVDSQDNG